MPAVSSALLRAALPRYDAALALRQAKDKAASELVELDAWFRNTLRSKIKERIEEGDGHLTKEELSRLMKWKLSRGSWRPRLQSLVDDLSSSLVLSTTRQALTVYQSGSPSDALSQLSKLPGVGPATASAILSAAWPQKETFMSDEAMLYAVGMPKNYTPKDWRTLRSGMEKRVGEEGWKDVEELERAAWSYGMLVKFGEDEGGEGKEKKEGKTVGEKRKAGGAPATTTTVVASSSSTNKRSRPSSTTAREKDVKDLASSEGESISTTTRSGRRSTRSSRA